MAVEEIKTTDEQEVPPRVTVSPAWKYLPVSVTDVPPVGDPSEGDIPRILGGSTNVKPPINFPESPLLFVTITFEARVFKFLSGEITVHVIVVADWTVTDEHS